ncbi:armadillo-type protein [Chytriomyces sp. MP71]|nr:armadillo-type protein [Chytriomyces sp. MP71]
MEINNSKPHPTQRLAAVLASLADTSARIADPSRHEKVLSYLKDETAVLGAHAIVTNLNAFKVIEDCLESDDVRLLSLALRFAGTLLASEKETGPGIFQILKGQHPKILGKLLLYSTSRDADSRLRFGCIEALNGLCQSDHAVQWLVEKEAISDIIWCAFEDDCIYVSASLTTLLKTLITSPRPIQISKTILSSSEFGRHVLLNNLIVQGNLFQLLESVLLDTDWRPFCAHPDAKEDILRNRPVVQQPVEKRILVLTLIWELCRAENRRAAVSFLKDARLIRALFARYRVETDRLVLSRMFDVMRELVCGPVADVGLFDAAAATFLPFPAGKFPALFRNLVACGLLPLLESSVDRHDVLLVTKLMGIIKVGASCLASSLSRSAVDSYLWLLWTVFRGAIDALATWEDSVMGWNMLTLPRLQIQVDGPDAILSTRIVDLIRSRLSKVAEIASQHRHITRCLLDVVLDLSEAVSICLEAGPVSRHSQDAVLSMMRMCIIEPSIRKVNRIAQVAMGNLNRFLKVVDASFSVEEITEILTHIIEDPDTKPSILKLAFTAVPNLFRFATFTNAHKSQLTEPILSRFYDMEWEVRTMTLHLASTLFQSPQPQQLAFSLPLLVPVLNRCKDAEPGVRHAALTATRDLVVASPRGWAHLCASNHCDAFLTALVRVYLQDSEALVRRTALEVLRALVVADGLVTQGLFCHDDVANGDRVGPTRLHRLVVNDPDWEVRVRALNLLETLFCLKDGTGIQTGVWFYQLKGTKLVKEATVDTSRIVRAEAAKLVSTLLAALDGQMAFPNRSRKRAFVCIESPEVDLLEMLQAIDLPALVEGSTAEHIYEEALDMNANYLQEGEELNEGNNILCCYDC